MPHTLCAGYMCLLPESFCEGLMQSRRTNEVIVLGCIASQSSLCALAWHIILLNADLQCRFTCAVQAIAALNEQKRSVECSFYIQQS